MADRPGSRATYAKVGSALCLLVLLGAGAIAAGDSQPGAPRAGTPRAAELRAPHGFPTAPEQIQKLLETAGSCVAGALAHGAAEPGATAIGPGSAALASGVYLQSPLVASPRELSLEVCNRPNGSLFLPEHAR